MWACLRMGGCLPRLMCVGERSVLPVYHFCLGDQTRVIRGWKDGSAVKGWYCFCWRPKFCSQNPYQAAHIWQGGWIWGLKALWAPAVTCTYPQTNIHTQNKTEIILRNWRDALVVKSRYCSSRGPEFSSQYPYRQLTIAYNSNSRIYPCLLPPWSLYFCVQTYTQTTHTHIMIKNF